MRAKSARNDYRPTIAETFGKRLSRERAAHGQSLTELAVRVGVTKGYLSRLERSKAKPSKGMVQRIADALRVDSATLQVLAGYLPSDVTEILRSHPAEAPAVLRERFAVYRSGAGVSGPRRHPKPPSVTSLDTHVGSLYELINSDCFEWLEQRSANSIHAVVTDPPYGLKEYTSEEQEKLRKGLGGVWRIPPAFDGCTRSPVPRFTVLTDEDKARLRDFFASWGSRLIRVLVPGAHVFVATNPLVSHLVCLAMTEAGFEKRGEIVRLVQTLRGGDRPKNAHEEFDMVTVMPRSCWEPWGLFRKPCEGRVQDNLRKWKTGGLRRTSPERPFCDVIVSAPTRGAEREIAPHPSLKPQAFMRQVVRASLPLEEGIVLDPFAGAGSTLAAACAVGYHSIGIESDREFYTMAVRAVPRLAMLAPGNGFPGSADGDRTRGQEALFD